MFLIFQGDDLAQIVRQFFKENALQDHAIPIVEKKLRTAARKADIKNLLMALPVVLDDGRLRVLAVYDSVPERSEGDSAELIASQVNVTQIVRKAFAQWNVSLDMENYEKREEALVTRVESLLVDHLERPLLVELPLDAPDGRKLNLQVCLLVALRDCLLSLFLVQGCPH